MPLDHLLLKRKRVEQSVMIDKKETGKEIENETTETNFYLNLKKKTSFIASLFLF